MMNLLEIRRLQRIKPWFANVLLCGLCALALSPCAKGQADQVNELLARLKDPGSFDIVVAALGEIGSPAVDPLIAALRSTDSDIRAGAATALGKIKDPRAIDPLIAALKERRFPRLTAIKALGGVGDPRAVKFLIIVLKDKDDFVRGAAADALGEIKDPNAVESLTVTLKVDIAWVRGRAALALGKIRDPRAVEPLIAALKSKDQFGVVRSAAAEALGEIGDPRAVRPLITTLSDFSAGESAARALGEIKDPSSVVPLIAALKEHESSSAQSAAAWALGEIKDARGIEPLIAALKVTNGLDCCRSVAAKALGKIGSPAVEPLILALREGDDREGAFLALEEIKDPRAIKALTTFLKTDLKFIAADYAFFVKAGIPETEDALIQALDKYGDLGMALNLLNCGNVRLELAATSWGEEHSLSTVMEQGSPGLTWGGNK